MSRSEPILMLPCPAVLGDLCLLQAVRSSRLQPGCRRREAGLRAGVLGAEHLEEQHRTGPAFSGPTAPDVVTKLQTRQSPREMGVVRGVQGKSCSELMEAWRAHQVTGKCRGAGPAPGTGRCPEGVRCRFLAISFPHPGGGWEVRRRGEPGTHVHCGKWERRLSQGNDGRARTLGLIDQIARLPLSQKDLHLQLPPAKCEGFRPLHVQAYEGMMVLYISAFLLCKNNSIKLF